MYAVASGLVGLPSSTLRVAVTRTQDDYVWVTTADLLDAGTRLVLSASQVEAEQAPTTMQHRSALVVMEG